MTPDPTDLKQASARGVAWNLLQNVFSRLLALVVVAILSRLLDRTAFGGVALALAITTLAELLVSQGFGEFVTQTSKLRDEHLDTAFWFNFGAGLLFAAGIAITAPALARALDEPEMAPVIRWLALSVVIRSLAVVPTGILVRELKFRSLTLRNLVASAVGGAAGIGSALAGLGVYSLVIQLLVAELVSTIALWRATSWRPGRRFDVTSLKELSAYGTPVIGATLLAFAVRRFDTVIVGGVLGLASLGVYSMAQRVYQIVLQVLNKSTTDVVFSAMSRLSDAEERRRQVFYRVTELTAVMCFPTYAGLAIVAEPLTLTLFGASWRDSADVLVMFALSGIPFSLTTLHISIIKSTARTRALFFINAFLLAIFLPTMWLLVERGPAHAAAASLISCTLIVPVELAFIRAALDLRVRAYLLALVPALCAAAVMAAGTIPLIRITDDLLPAAQLATVAIAGALLYSVALRILAPAAFARCRQLAASVVRRRRPPL